ncbi:MAG TPA: winged helix-turn-helix transcriptional regulator [Solirubrobacter sp.]
MEGDLIARMRELRPLVDEYLELQATARRLEMQLPPDALADRLAGAAPGAQPRAQPAARPRRRRVQARPGERRQQILELVSGRPGLTVRQLGEALGVDPTSLYRPVRELIATATLRKDGQRLYSADSQR